MTFNPLRALFLLLVAALEVTLLHFGVTLITLAFVDQPMLNWFVLLLTCLIAAWATARFQPVEDEPRWLNRPLLIALVITVAYAVKAQVGGGWSPVSGWLVLWPYAGDAATASALFPVLLSTLWVWWRGMTVLDNDHGALVTLLQRGVLTLVLLAIVITPLSGLNLGAPPWGPLLAAEAILIIVFGLLSLALARIVGDEATNWAGNGWRWFRSSVLTALGLIVVGTLLLSLVSDTATLAVRSFLFVIISSLGLIVSPFATLLQRLWIWLGLGNTFDRPAPPPQSSAYPVPDQQAQPPSGLELRIIEIISVMFNVAVVLLPILVLLVLILLVRRRRLNQPTQDGAIHESLWSWRALGADLRGLLGGLKLNRASQLRDAFARLRSADPIQRIRRRYIQALLLGEHAEREREPHQTPLEYAPSLTDVVPAADQEIRTLTAAYDRARYAPETIQATDAEAADAAWTTINARSKENH